MQDSKCQTKRVAIIDLGSNTFHLIIVEIDLKQQSFKLLRRKRDFVYLSKDGIEHLSTETMERALKSLRKLKSICQEYEVGIIKCIGTAALRSASNSNVFIESVEIELNLDIEVIDGQREAELIHKGCLFTKVNSDVPILIIDIGGGSVEFILSQDEKMLFYSSKNVGVSVLKKKYRKEGLISEDTLNKIHFFLTEELQEVRKAIHKYQPTIILGPSGPFEILESYVGFKPSGEGNLIAKVFSEQLKEKVYSLDTKGREALEFMPENRSDLSLESFILLDFIFKSGPSLEQICVTPYALKEGVVRELMDYHAQI